MVGDRPHLHPGCTGTLDSVCGCVGLLGNFLHDRAWDTHLSSCATQQLQPAQMAEKDEGRGIHHPDTHGASSAAALSSASICSSATLMAWNPYPPSLWRNATRPSPAMAAAFPELSFPNSKSLAAARNRTSAANCSSVILSNPGHSSG